MHITNTTQHQREAGFTLVELAIVMIIIGLLIGGILKGQELIANAQSTATISQVKAIDAAVSTFRDKYSAFPGDILNPSQRLAGCTAAPCNTGAAAAPYGDGRINVPAALGTAPTAGTQESAAAFAHLAAADLISSIDLTATGAPVFGGLLPEAKLGGGFWIGYTANGAALPALTGLRIGHYLVLNGTNTNVTATSGSLSAVQTGRIDRKTDDGLPNAGTVQAPVGGTCTQTIAGAIAYNEDDQASACSLYFRVQG